MWLETLPLGASLRAPRPGVGRLEVAGPCTASDHHQGGSGRSRVRSWSHSRSQRSCNCMTWFGSAA